MKIEPCTRPKPECVQTVVKSIMGGFYVYCPRCGSSAGIGKSRAEAISIWNYWRELDKPKQRQRTNTRGSASGTADQGAE